MEETKETSPKKPSEDLDSGSGEATTSAKSQSTPEREEAAARSITKDSEGDAKSLKKDKWWLKGVNGKELTQIEVDEEPLIFM